MAKLSRRPRNKSQVREVPKLISSAILKAHSHPSLSPAPQGQGLEYPFWRLTPVSKAGVSWTKTSHCLTIAPRVTKSIKIPEIFTSSAHYKAVYYHITPFSKSTTYKILSDYTFYTWECQVYSTENISICPLCLPPLTQWLTTEQMGQVQSSWFHPRAPADELPSKKSLKIIPPSPIICTHPVTVY